MLHLKTWRLDLPFEYPFTIAKGTKTHQPSLVVGLGLGRMAGYGEAPAIHYYGVTVEKMIEVLESKRGVIERYSLIDPQRFWHFLHHLIPGENFLIAALDIAGWDLWGQLKRVPLYKLFNADINTGPQSDYTLGIDTAEKMVEKMKAKPWPIYKIKLRCADDIDLVRALRANTDATFRVDANESLTFDEAKKLIPELQLLGVHLVEQPLSKTAHDEMKELKAISALPIFADESCVEEKDVVRCAEGFHGINIKLTKCGGITPALRMIEQARKLNLNIMIGSMNESSVGTAAMAHLAPLVDELDADGPLLLQGDKTTGLIYDGWRPKPAEIPGLGVRFVPN